MDWQLMKKWLNLNVFEMKYDFTDTQSKLGLLRPYLPFNLSLIVNQNTDLYVPRWNSDKEPLYWI